MVRLFWGAVAALHIFIFARKLATGPVEGIFDQGRLALLIIASVYGLARGWSAAGRINLSPKRFWAFALAMVLGHCAVSSSAYAERARESAAEIDWSRIALVSCQGALLLGAIAGAAALSRLGPVRRRRAFAPSIKVASSPEPFAPRPRPALFERPPPFAHTQASL